jgi:hypothetical protein
VKPSEGVTETPVFVAVRKCFLLSNESLTAISNRGRVRAASRSSKRQGFDFIREIPAGGKDVGLKLFFILLLRFRCSGVHSLRFCFLQRVRAFAFSPSK